MKFYNQKNLILPVRHFLGYFFPKKNILTSSLIRHLVYVSICCQAFGITRTILQAVPGENVSKSKRTQEKTHPIPRVRFLQEKMYPGTLCLLFFFFLEKVVYKNHKHNKKLIYCIKRYMNLIDDII